MHATSLYDDALTQTVAREGSSQDFCHTYKPGCASQNQSSQIRRTSQRVGASCDEGVAFGEQFSELLLFFGESSMGVGEKATFYLQKHIYMIEIMFRDDWSYESVT